MAYILAICDKEKVFVQLLSDFLRRKYRGRMEIEAFDNADSLLAMHKNKKSRVCLVGEGMLSAFQTEEIVQATGLLVCLSTRRRQDCVFKLQSVENIVKDLTVFCMEHHNPLPGYAQQPRKWADRRLIGFYSPAHHMMQSSLALTMGQILAKEKKVLYLNFEPYSGFEYMMQKSFRQDLMDAVYFLKEDTEKFRMHMTGMIETMNGLDYIPPVFCYPDMAEIEPDMWHKLIERLISEFAYEVIILDLTEQVRGLFSLLESCNEIYCPIAPDKLSDAKMTHYEKMLTYMKQEQLQEKMKTCTLPAWKEIPAKAALLSHSQLARYVREHMLAPGLHDRDTEPCISG